MIKRIPFLMGLFVLCMSVLLQQVAFTRILSVVSYYHLAFIVISMAMLGMSAGAIWAYMRGVKADDLGRLLPKVTLLYSVATLIALGMVTNTIQSFYSPVAMAFALAQIILALLMPFGLAGIAVSLALTRGPGPVGVTYAVDLIGAAIGCLLYVPLLNVLSGVNAVLFAAGMGVLAAILFHLASAARALEAVSLRYLMPLFVIAALISIDPHGSSVFPLFSLKTEDSRQQDISFERWNTFSQITVSRPRLMPNFAWGPSPKMPATESEQRILLIDKMAASPLYKMDASHKPDFLEWDITNFAYTIRHSGQAAVIGIGGGRDIMAARHFGFEHVTAVELNPIMVALLTQEQPYADFVGLNKDDHISFNVDDGRSWFARTHEKFDLLQLSMVDTFAATGAGVYTLSENGLYTVEGWQHFINALTPTGVFTVSRWHAQSNVAESGRLLALAKAALFKAGIADPAAHLFLVGSHGLATLVLSRAPLTSEEIAKLTQRARDLEFHILVQPDKSPESDVLREIMAAPDEAALWRVSSTQLLDLTPPTDWRPFFFNQLNLLNPASISLALSSEGSGVVHGNLKATISLLFVVVFSGAIVALVLLLPALESVRRVAPAYAVAGSSYFFLIGCGFMLLEMGLIQRMSVFLGHPVYGLTVVLFGIILMTGLGSLVSDRIPLRFVRVWPVLVALAAAAMVIAIGPLTAAYEQADIVTRAAVAVGIMAPAALLMGFGFPAGMRLASAIDATPTPWLWAMNGAAGVLAGGLSLVVSMTFSIKITLLAGALAYLLLLIPVNRLMKLANSAAIR